MPQARFVVEEVFDLPQRGGLLAVGKVLSGVIAPGMVLADEATGHRTTVLGVEFPTPRTLRTGRHTLVLERTVPSPVVAGRVLASPT